MCVPSQKAPVFTPIQKSILNFVALQKLRNPALVRGVVHAEPLKEMAKCCYE